MKISQEKGGSKNKLRYDVIYEINIIRQTRNILHQIYYLFWINKEQDWS